ncbi:MAG: amidohydrolase [Candidatus Altiarchaeales archaeon]|nr:MAG: amidohydrolase [Candidatus Altiarchaeales archaeon]
MSILIKNIMLNGKETSIYIEENLITEIGANTEADHIIDGKNKAAIPGLINTHTHAAMTLFRSYADDMKLHEWLQKKIWPLEAKLTEEDVYWGTKLACLEMIKTGTTCFNDMYWRMNGAVKAVDEMGIRAVLSGVFIDLFDGEIGKKEVKNTKRFIKEIKALKNERIIPALGPHALYTVSRENLQWIREYSDKENLLIHFHLAETERENKECVERYGKKPVPFLEEINFLGENLVAAHCNWLDRKDIEILSKFNVKISHNPVSNMKLSSGFLPYTKMRNSGLVISLGTDGCASNNNLDMFESMKFAALLQKIHRNEPTVMPAEEAFQLATLNGAKSLQINSGIIEEEKLADIVLIDLKRPELAPNHNLISNLVYSANGSCVDTVICDGRILMQNRKVDGEGEILKKVWEVASDLVSR